MLLHPRCVVSFSRIPFPETIKLWARGFCHVRTKFVLAFVYNYHSEVFLLTFIHHCTTFQGNNWKMKLFSHHLLCSSPAEMFDIYHRRWWALTEANSNAQIWQKLCCVSLSYNVFDNMELKVMLNKAWENDRELHKKLQGVAPCSLGPVRTLAHITAARTLVRMSTANVLCVSFSV